MKRELYLGLDQGSSATKGIVVDRSGEILFSESVLVATNSTGDAVEQDPAEILDSIKALVGRAESFARRHGIRACGLALQRSGVLAWNSRSGAAEHPVMTWRDKRASAELEFARADCVEVSRLSGLPLTFHYAAPKIAYLQKRYSGAEVRTGTLDTFIIRNSAGTLLAEETHAARTMLYNLDTRAWDKRLTSIFRVRYEELPPVVPSLYDFGALSAIPLRAICGDQQCSYIGNFPKDEGVVLNLGTVASLLIPTGAVPRVERGFIVTPLPTSVSAPRYLLEGTVNSCGAIIRRALRELHPGATIRDLDKLAFYARNRGASPSLCAFCPFLGVAAPEWRYDLPALITGWCGKDPAAFALAMLEGLGGFLALLFERMSVITGGINTLSVSGGAQSEYLLQYLSDLLGIEIASLVESEAGALGAALLCARSIGAEISGIQTRAGKIFHPSDPSARDRYKRWLALRERIYRNDLPQDALELKG